MARPADPAGASAPSDLEIARTAPLRTCIGCRRRRAPEELTRFVRAADRSLRIGRTLAGRGAWLCQGSTECFELAARQGGFARAFRAPVSATEVDALRVELRDGVGHHEHPFVPGRPAARD
ncbi:YlxR family protein [soil metagenome]